MNYSTVITYLLLGINLLVTLPVPFVFFFGLPAPIDPNDAGAVGIAKEYAWNPRFAQTFGSAVPALTASWFGLAFGGVPRIWRISSVATAVFGVLYVNVLVEDAFLEHHFGAGMPTSGFIAHYIQALAFASVLLPSTAKPISRQSKKPLWAQGVWWMLALVHAFKLLDISMALGLRLKRNLKDDVLYEMEHHALATGSLVWNQIALMPATLALSWYTHRTSKIIPFGILAISTILVGNKHPQSDQILSHWIVAIAYGLQIWIPGPNISTTHNNDKAAHSKAK